MTDKQYSYVRKAFKMGSSYVISIHPELVTQFNADDPFIFFEQVGTEQGILLKPRRLMAIEEKETSVAPKIQVKKKA